ncbi:ergothioneine biosynthesis glutamate--cysteine ligase EgtA, partial [Frankia sp. AgKG'84/4]|nr:ergothioneine biosynthesis glutamate--cysteine ligase EgtA [Frankia sp. AgKG'84/4]
MPRHATPRGPGADASPPDRSTPGEARAHPSQSRQSAVRPASLASADAAACASSARRLDRDAVLAFAADCVLPTPTLNPGPGASGDTAAPGKNADPGTGARSGTSVGIETEWFVVDSQDVHRPVEPARTLRALAAIGGGPDSGEAILAAGSVLPGGSRITFEPGGQLELSGPPAPLAAAIRSTGEDLRLVRSALAEDGLAIVGMGTDPLRAGTRHTDASRYAAMEEHFQRGGGNAGLDMMRSTASVQVNLDLGATAAEAAQRFRLAHTMGPVLTAMFAASPMLAGRRTGWCSSRQRIWAGIHASRTGAVLELADRAGGIPAEDDGAPPPAEVVQRWARYLCDARLMLIADLEGEAGPVTAGEEHQFRAATGGHTLADWLDGRGPVSRAPTLDDLRYHATTLFPPVRPRGWWELRYLDAQPADGWRVAVAVTTALLDDPIAATGAARACAPVARS